MTHNQAILVGLGLGAVAIIMVIIYVYEKFKAKADDEAAARTTWIEQHQQTYDPRPPLSERIVSAPVIEPLPLPPAPKPKAKRKPPVKRASKGKASKK